MTIIIFTSQGMFHKCCDYDCLRCLLFKMGGGGGDLEQVNTISAKILPAS